MFFLLEIVHRDLSNYLTQFGLVLFVFFKNTVLYSRAFLLLYWASKETAGCHLCYPVIYLTSLKTIWNQLCSQNWECWIPRMLKAFAVHQGFLQTVVDVALSDRPGMSSYYNLPLAGAGLRLSAPSHPNSATSFLCAKKTMNFISRKGRFTQNMSSISSLLLLWLCIA